MRKKHLLVVLAMLILLPACQDESSNLKVSQHKDFDHSVISALETYGLSVSDFEPGTDITVGKDVTSARRNNHITQKTLAIGNEQIAYYETSGNGPDVLLIHGN